MSTRQWAGGVGTFRVPRLSLRKRVAGPSAGRQVARSRGRERGTQFRMLKPLRVRVSERSASRRREPDKSVPDRLSDPHSRDKLVRRTWLTYH